MKGFLILFFGMFLGYVAYPKINPPALPPEPVVIAATPTPPKVVYDNPLNRGAYDKRTGVASRPIIYGTYPAPTPR